MAVVNKGIWVWPSDERAQGVLLTAITKSPHLIAAMSALAKSKDGLSNAQLDDTLGDNSNWMTLWVVRQLTALGFAEFRVDLFGGPAKYFLTELGTSVLSRVTGKPAPVQPKSAPTPTVAKPA